MVSQDPTWSLRRDQSFFQRAQRSGNVVFVIYSEILLNQHHFTQSVIVPKTVSLLAVTRNRLKRQIKTLLAGLELPAGHIVAVVKPAALRASYWELQQSLLHALRKIRA